MVFVWWVKVQKVKVMGLMQGEGENLEAEDETECANKLPMESFAALLDGEGALVHLSAYR